MGLLDDPKSYSGLFRYLETKFVIDAFARGLAELSSSSEVIVNNFCPGMIEGTDIDSHHPFWLRIWLNFYRSCIGRSVSAGARTYVYAIAIAGPESHGKFLQHNEVDE